VCVCYELAKLEADCFVLFMVSCGEKNNRYMLSQGQPEGFNIEACWPCEQIRISHIETEGEKQANSPTGLVSFAVL
jgi:hypothetical protein